MTLPFPKNDGVRKYNCFVCGMQYTDFELYNEHIRVNHEEGREYILCPLLRCKCCVRDLRTHFKVKHPGTPMPKNGQMKAIVWKDQKSDGKLKTRKPRFREGFFMSNKNGGKEMHYRSGKECEVYECLEFMPEVMKYDVEPFAVKYSLDGEVHEYNPDISVVFDDGRVEVWEVKPANQTDLPINQAKWTACQQHCETRGWGFMVITEVGIDKLKKRLRSEQHGRN